MTLSQWGLLADIIGVVILFFYGFPNGYKEVEKHYTIVINERSTDEVEKEEDSNKWIKRAAVLGLLFILAGFFLQFIATLFK